MGEESTDDRADEGRGRTGGTLMSAGPVSTASILGFPVFADGRHVGHVTGVLADPECERVFGLEVAGTAPHRDAWRQRRHGVTHVLVLRLVTGKRGARLGVRKRRQENPSPGAEARRCEGGRAMRTDRRLRLPAEGGGASPAAQWLLSPC